MTNLDLNFQKEVTLKTGKKVLLRYPRMSDFDSFFAYHNAFANEDLPTYICMPSSYEAAMGYLVDHIRANREGKAIHLAAFDEKNQYLGSASIDRKGTRRTHIGELGIGLKREMRNQGLGRALIEEVIRQAIVSFDIKMVVLETFAINDRAVHLYKSLGFKEYGRLPGGLEYRSKYADKLLMYKNVNGLADVPTLSTVNVLQGKTVYSASDVSEIKKEQTIYKPPAALVKASEDGMKKAGVKKPALIPVIEKNDPRYAYCEKMTEEVLQRLCAGEVEIPLGPLVPINQLAEQMTIAAKFYAIMSKGKDASPTEIAQSEHGLRLHESEHVLQGGPDIKASFSVAAWADAYPLQVDGNGALPQPGLGFGVCYYTPPLTLDDHLKMLKGVDGHRRSDVDDACIKTCEILKNEGFKGKITLWKLKEEAKKRGFRIPCNKGRKPRRLFGY